MASKNQDYEKRKQSLYFPSDLLTDIRAEAYRQDRSFSWLMQQAWRIARPHIGRLPTVNEAPKRSTRPPTQAEQFARKAFR